MIEKGQKKEGVKRKTSRDAPWQEGRCRRWRPENPSESSARAYGILGVPKMVTRLLRKPWRNPPLAKVVGTRMMPQAQAKKYIKRLKMGDIIVYLNSRGGYAHMALPLYDGRIACHTRSRLDKMWTDVHLPKVTLLHIL